jgi:hypothetical protein
VRWPPACKDVNGFCSERQRGQRLLNLEAEELLPGNASEDFEE